MTAPWTWASLEHVPEGNNKRRHERFNFVAPAVLVRGRKEMQLHTEDVSFGGLFLRTDNPPPLRDLVKIRLVLPSDHQEIELLGMAVHRVPPGGPRLAGIGVLLYGLDPALRARWENFVQEVRLGRHGKGPTQDLVWPDHPAAPAVKDYRPELRVNLPHRAAMETIRDRDLPRKRTFVRTELYLEKGTKTSVVFVHPDSGRLFTLGGEVMQPIRRDNMTGLALSLEGVTPKVIQEFNEFLEDDIHVTVDVDLDMDFDPFSDGTSVSS